MVLAPRTYSYCVRTSINIIKRPRPGSPSEKSSYGFDNVGGAALDIVRLDTP